MKKRRTKATTSTKTANSKSLDDSFEATARRLECDEDKERFEAKLGKIVKAKPKPAAKRRSK
jgi:hypothetical protein